MNALSFVIIKWAQLSFVLSQSRQKGLAIYRATCVALRAQSHGKN